MHSSHSPNEKLLEIFYKNPDDRSVFGILSNLTSNKDNKYSNEIQKKAWELVDQLYPLSIEYFKTQTKLTDELNTLKSIIEKNEINIKQLNKQLDECLQIAHETLIESIKKINDPKVRAIFNTLVTELNKEEDQSQKTRIESSLIYLNDLSENDKKKVLEKIEGQQSKKTSNNESKGIINSLTNGLRNWFTKRDDKDYKINDILKIIEEDKIDRGYNKISGVNLFDPNQLKKLDESQLEELLREEEEENRKGLGPAQKVPGSHNPDKIETTEKKVDGGPENPGLDKAQVAQPPAENSTGKLNTAGEGGEEEEEPPKPEVQEKPEDEELSEESEEEEEEESLKEEEKEELEKSTPPTPAAPPTK